MIFLIFLPPSLFIVPPINAGGGRLAGIGIPALVAVSIASIVDFSSSPGRCTCFSSSPWFESKSDRIERRDETESRWCHAEVVANHALRKVKSSPPISKFLSSSQFSDGLLNHRLTRFQCQLIHRVSACCNCERVVWSECKAFSAKARWKALQENSIVQGNIDRAIIRVVDSWSRGPEKLLLSCFVNMQRR